MQQVLLWTAAGASLVTFVVHTFVGGPRVAKPLLESTTLPAASKWLNYYCWHMVTIYTFSMAAGYAYSAVFPQRSELLMFLTVLNTAFAILSAAVAAKGGINPLRFPSTTLFSLLSVLGILSLAVPVS